MTIDSIDLGKAYVFGLTLSLTIGPMALLIVQRCVSRGPGSAFHTASGIAGADLICGLLAFLVGSPVLRMIERHGDAVRFIAGAVLVVMALSIVGNAVRTYGAGKLPDPARARGNDFLSAFGLTMVNPSTIVVLLGFLGSLPIPAGIGEAVLLAIAFFVGSLTGQCLIATLATLVRGFFRHPLNLLLLNICSAAGIAFFGVTGLIAVFR